MVFLFQKWLNFEGLEPSSRQTDEGLEKCIKSSIRTDGIQLTKFVTFQAYLYGTC
jgi:hypothetical protein